MKYIFFVFIFFFAIVPCIAQKADTINPAPKPPAVRDYNFTFVTTGTYTVFTLTHKLDSLPGGGIGYKEVQDTSTAAVQVIVHKQGGALTITSTDPTSAETQFYNAKVRFLGLANDGMGSYAYRADTETRETIIVNPSYGFAAVFFKTCDKNKICDLVNHYFGAMTLQKQPKP